MLEHVRTFLVRLFALTRRPGIRIAFFAALVCAVVRLIPFVAPIRMATLSADTPAVDFFDRNGLPLGTVLSRDQEHTAYVPLDQVAPDFVDAIVAAEDGRFWHHGPLDGAAAVRAVWQLLREHKVVSGASTITMQLARMLDPVGGGVVGKTAQIWGAWRIAAGSDRAQILEAYVNRLPMGGNIYGVEAAARIYFGTTAARLDLAQASLLAALPNDPTGLDPYDKLAALRSRQSYVLERMVADGYVTQAQASAAKAEGISLRPRGGGIVAAPHLLFYIAPALPPGTSRVRTTLDRPLQEFVEEQVRQTIGDLAGHDAHQAAALVVDNRTGEVLAYVGSADYFDRSELGSNDGVQSLRQPGSTLKPFLYQFALQERSIHPNTILEDVPSYYAIPGGELYSPSDYSGDYLGPVRVRVALADSLNVPAVRVLSSIGVSSFLDRLHALGFAHLTHPPEYYGLGLTLGSGEVSLWELTHAYLTAARGGVAIPLRTIYRGSSSVPTLERPVGDSTSWALVADMLADAHARAASFGVNSMLAPPFPAAVKTGTSSDYRDTWTVGYTTEYTVGIWVGNFDGRPMRNVSGVTGAAPLWNRIMLHLHEGRDPDPFDPPSGLVRERICATTGGIPGPTCPATVLEYLYPQDLAAYFATRPPRCCASGDRTSSAAASAPILTGVHIVFPHDGDTFVLHVADSTTETTGAQALEFQAAASKGANVRWRLDGSPLASNGTASPIWRLRPGRFALEATAGSAHDRIEFSVRLTVPQALPTGFSTTPP
jgi:penicillin-binding protein 1C